AATSAFAQTAPKPADTTSAQVEEIIVTGTRTEGRTRLESLAPVDVISQKALTRQGTPELASALATVAPSIDFPRPAITDGTDSIRPATLRGLAPDQTLVLVDGMRRHTSALVNINGSIGRGSAAVDLNAIPTIALDHVEVLRDGASAQYGSDAIAGVINLHLREARSGGEAMAMYGVYDTDVKTARDPGGQTKHDGPTYQIAGWQGLPLGDQGFLTLSAEYRYRNPTSRGDLDPRLNPPRITSRFGDPEEQDTSFYANSSLPLNDTWSLYGFGGYQKRKTNSAGFPRLAGDSRNTPSIYPNGFLPLITTDIDDYSVAGGTKGEALGFNVNAGLVYGYDKINYGVIHSLNASMGAASPTSFDAGSMRYDQLVASLDLDRNYDAGLAKPVNLAFGVEYRHEGYAIGAGDTPSWEFGGIAGKAAGAQVFPGFKPENQVDKGRHSEAAYIDVDAPFTTALDVDAAARYENYSDFGSTVNGKVSARYAFTDAFALRGTVASGFRAPALQQQYFTATSTNFILINGVSTPVDVGTFPSVSPVATALGGKPLEPEKSMNYSLGGVFHTGPFELTVDAYQINIKNRIVLSENIQGSPTGSPTSQAIFALINPPGSTGLGAARFFINGVNTETRGIDIVGHYVLTTDDLGHFDFTAAMNFNRTRVTKTPSTPQLSALPVPPVLFGRANVLTYEQGTPRQKHSLSVDWGLGAFGATATATYYGDVLVANDSPSLDYHTGSHTLVDIEGRYKLPMGAQIALGVDNLFDEYPNPTPAIVNSTGAVGFPSFSPFGFNGRYLYARLTLDW
ncbi:MAG: TonB-dependent receptor, partial [Alphaproteobacteria bacterium]|nr:TonB-dependent receptor [Alphaproteobacteria bacterium]